MGWVTYNIPSKSFDIKVDPYLVVNNKKIEFHVTACNSGKVGQWPAEVSISEENGKVIGKAQRQCQGQSIECTYVLAKPKFEHEGKYSLQIGDFGVGEVEVKFKPNITSIAFENNEIVVAINNITQEQLTSLGLYLDFRGKGKQQCCTHEFGNLCFFGYEPLVASIKGPNNRGWRLISLRTTKGGLPLAMNTARVSISGCSEACWKKCKDKIRLTLRINDGIHLQVWPSQQ